MLRLMLATAALMPAIAFADVPVTIQNFNRAETDGYLIKNAAAGIGVFTHARNAVAVDEQDVIRMNRDTLYSFVVLDLTTPATITLPDSGDRFMSMQVINQDHYTKAVNYDPGEYTLTQEEIGTRYVTVLIRTFMDPNDPDDLAAAHALQDALAVTQESPGTLDLPDWNSAQRDAIRDLLNQLGSYDDQSGVRFGDVDEVNPISFLIGTAAGWGGNPPEAAEYIFQKVDNNDGQTAYDLTLQDVPVDGFWSITVYNKDGFMEAPIEAAALNNVTATPNDDGSYTLHFGGDPAGPNYLQVMDGWTYVIRLYRPRPEVLDGSWTPPAAVEVQ